MAMKELLIEAKVLEKMQGGSYEERLSMLDKAVNENSGMFGDGDSVLFSTFDDKVTVVNESGTFYSAGYKIRDGAVKFSAPTVMDVDVLSEENLPAKAVDDFFESGSVSSKLRGLVQMHKPVEPGLLGEAQSELDVLFSGGKLWKRIMEEHKDKISGYGWDVKYGKLDVGVHPAFLEVLTGDDSEISEDIADEIQMGLTDLEVRLLDQLNSVTEAVEIYQVKTSGMTGDEAGQVLSQFEGFASDYIEYLEAVSGRVSRAISEMNDGGCALCAALVHDEVAQRYKDMDLAGRFVRKISDSFGQ
jgi:hypothetical protein